MFVSADFKRSIRWYQVIKSGNEN